MSQNSWVCDSATQPAPRTLPRGPPAPIPRHAPGRLAPDDGRPPLGFGGWGGEVGSGGALLLGGGVHEARGQGGQSHHQRVCRAEGAQQHQSCPSTRLARLPTRGAGALDALLAAAAGGLRRGLFHPSGGAVGGLGGGAVLSEGLWSSWPTGPQNMPGHPGHTPPPLGASRELRGARARRELASPFTDFCKG